MRLRFIYEAKALNALYSPDQMTAIKRQLAQAMPKYKQKHSKRVANHLATSNLPKEVVDAGFYHDYLERGGDPSELRLGDHSMELVNHMTNPDKDTEDDPLAHLQQIIPTITDPRVRNHLCLLKMADRVDNLIRRVKRKKLTTKYLKYSKRLLRWLDSQYDGPRHHVVVLLAKLHKYGLNV